MAETVAPLREAIDLIEEAGGESSRLCYQCGLCDSACPWNLVKDFMIRKIVREAQFGLTEIDRDDIWQCAACGKCPARCPRGVEVVDIMLSVRRIATEYNILPQGVRVAKGSLTGEGNP